jgi:hypothetical protein
MLAEPPIGIAMVVCDQILEDSNTSKRSLIGLFNTVACESFPACLTKLCVFVSVTQILGRVSLTLMCRNETTDERIVSVPGAAESNQPNAVLEIGYEFDNFSFPRPGLYTFELLHEEEQLLQTRFNVIEVFPNPQKLLI